MNRNRHPTLSVTIEAWLTQMLRALTAECNSPYTGADSGVALQKLLYYL